MIDQLFHYLTLADDFYWQYIGFALLIVAGFYFSYRSGFYQIRVIEHLPNTIKSLMADAKKETPGVSPIRLYFASIGGMIGLGNIVAVITALTVGGPGALFWLWVAAFAGMIIKYAEIYLGMQYRVARNEDGYDGGPMYTLKAAFPGKIGAVLAIIASILLAIYGVEVYQFTVITDTIHSSLPIDRELIILPLLLVIIYIGLGGVRRLANLCAYMMPAFIVVYIIMCLWVIGINYAGIPAMLIDVFKSAFTGHAGLGGFAGSTMLIAAQQGAARAAYSADIAIGFDSIIQSETKALNPQRQARLAIVSSITDAFICTLSIAVVYLTGLWHSSEALMTSDLVSHALTSYIPYANVMIVFIIFLAGFTTIQAYFTVGLKAARYLSPRFGKVLYFAYAIFAFWIFAHQDQTKVLIIMSLSGGLLILINLAGIIRLRDKISFKFLRDDKL